MEEPSQLEPPGPAEIAVLTTLHSFMTVSESQLRSQGSTWAPMLHDFLDVIDGLIHPMVQP